MEYLVKLEGPVLGFCVQDYYIDCLCGKKLQKVEKDSGIVLYEKEVFDKDGLARILIANQGQIFISDFCTLNVFDQDNFEFLYQWKIGEDLTSDICGMMVDEKTIYCSIRNGKLVTIDRSTLNVKDYLISNNSMWSLKIYKKYLLCGTVDGQLLLLDKKTLKVEKQLTLGKQNIRSLFIDGNLLYAASQDKKLFKIALNEFKVIDVIKKAHIKMFDCAGLYDDLIVTISHPYGEIAFRNKDTLEKKLDINIPLKLGGCAYIEEHKLFLTSRNICGIAFVDLYNLGGK